MYEEYFERIRARNHELVMERRAELIRRKGRIRRERRETVSDLLWFVILAATIYSMILAGGMYR